MNETLSATGETQLKAWLNGSGHTLTPDFGGDLSRNLESDLDFLEERLGQLPLGTAHLLLLRPPGGVSDGGWARTALNAIHVERDSGVLDREWPAIALHELAHHWFGRWVDLGADASWLEEGMPNLLKEMRYPGVTTTGPTAFENPPDYSLLYDGAASLLEAAYRGESSGLVVQGRRKRWVRYYAAPFVLAQLHAILRGVTGATDETIWQGWSDWLAAAGGSKQSADDISSLFSTGLVPGHETDLATAYSEWVTSRVSVPVLAFQSAAYDGTWAHVEVRQVQQQLDSSWPLFEYAPFYLGCAQLDLNDTSMPFPECHGSWLNPPTQDPLVVWNTSGVAPGWWSTSLTPTGGDPMPVRFAIVGPHHLLPEADMTYDFATETGESDRKGGDAFAIRCNSNGGDTACGTDADADGEHSDWDCDDADPAVYRGASDATGGVDWNCDGFLLQVSCDVGSPP